MLLYLRMVLPSSRTPPPQFSASSTNRRTTHLAGRRRQPLTPQTWASPAEPLAPRHVRLPLTPPPRVFPFSDDEKYSCMQLSYNGSRDEKKGFKTSSQ